MPIYIDDVIGKLKEIRLKEGNLKVCRIGHFGEINEMFLSQVYARGGRMGTWGDGKKQRVLSIDPPDIGPDPD